MQSAALGGKSMFWFFDFFEPAPTWVPPRGSSRGNRPGGSAPTTPEPNSRLHPIPPPVHCPRQCEPSILVLIKDTAGLRPPCGERGLDMFNQFGLAGFGTEGGTVNFLFFDRLFELNGCVFGKLSAATDWC